MTIDRKKRRIDSKIEDLFDDIFKRSGILKFVKKIPRISYFQDKHFVSNMSCKSIAKKCISHIIKMINFKKMSKQLKIPNWNALKILRYSKVKFTWKRPTIASKFLLGIYRWAFVSWNWNVSCYHEVYELQRNLLFSEEMYFTCFFFLANERRSRFKFLRNSCKIINNMSIL